VKACNSATTSTSRGNHEFRKKLAIAAIWFCLWPGFSADLLAAGYEFSAIESLIGETPQALRIQPHAIVISSSRQRFDKLPQNTRNALKGYFSYQARVKVNQTRARGPEEAKADFSECLGLSQVGCRTPGPGRVPAATGPQSKNRTRASRC
jgi:hypothetical protein